VAKRISFNALLHIRVMENLCLVAQHLLVLLPYIVAIQTNPVDGGDGGFGVFPSVRTVLFPSKPSALCQPAESTSP
jgi:hypothetical protein